MDLKIKGKIIDVPEMITGTKNNGEQWARQDVIIETEGQYPKKICIQLWNSVIDKQPIRIGVSYEFSINIESKEFNEKWFTNVTAWSVRSLTGNVPQQTQRPQSAPQPQAQPDFGNEEDFDLPF
jgi:hypothetical protein